MMDYDNRKKMRDAQRMETESDLETSLQLSAVNQKHHFNSRRSALDAEEALMAATQNIAMRIRKSWESP